MRFVVGIDWLAASVKKIGRGNLSYTFHPDHGSMLKMLGFSLLKLSQTITITEKESLVCI